MRSLKYISAAAAIAAWSIAWHPANAEDKSLHIVSWGGAYEESQDKAFFTPFSEETGIAIATSSYSGGLGEVRSQVETGNVHWDVFVGELALAKLGCEEGILEPIDHSILPAAADGTPAEEDFMPGALHECGVGAAIWSTVIAHRNDIEVAPESVADFFDVEKIPGRRGLRRSADINLEWALLADGVPADEVYEVLETPEGVERAFAKLDTIKDQVIWWEAGAQPPQLLADREVVMTSVYSARIFSAVHDEDQPFTILWDGQVWDIDVWMIPAGTPNLDEALQFVEFASVPEHQAELTRWSSYGPTRRSAADLIGIHAETGIEMEEWIPTAPANLENAIQADSEFWADHRDTLFDQFSIWLTR